MMDDFTLHMIAVDLRLGSFPEAAADPWTVQDRPPVYTFWCAGRLVDLVPLRGGGLGVMVSPDERREQIYKVKLKTPAHLVAVLRALERYEGQEACAA